MNNRIDHDMIDHDMIQEHGEQIFIDSITRRFRGRTVSYSEAYHIIMEMIQHMQAPEAHHIIYELWHGAYPFLDKKLKQRTERWELETRYAHPQYILDRVTGEPRVYMKEEIKHMKDSGMLHPDFEFRYTKGKITRFKKEEFLKKEDVEL